jgi:type III restriction enzyme
VIEYTDAAGNLRYYEPDFVAVLTDGKRYIVETKGQEDVNVANKDRAAAIWCENATALTGESWSYLKVKQSEYTKLQADTFADLSVFGQGVLPDVLV